MKVVKFKSMFRGAPDGKAVLTYRAGDVEPLPDKFADSAVRSGSADYVNDEQDSDKENDQEPQKSSESGPDGQDDSEDSESSEGSQSGSQDQESGSSKKTKRKRRTAM